MFVLGLCWVHFRPKAVGGLSPTYETRTGQGRLLGGVVSLGSSLTHSLSPSNCWGGAGSPGWGLACDFWVAFTEVESGARSPQAGRLVGRIPQAQWAVLDLVMAR